MFLLINGFPHFTWLDKLALIFDAAGHFKTMPFMVFALSVLGFLKKDKRLITAAFLFALTLGLTSFIILVLKNTFLRPRPFLLQAGLHVLGNARGGSFPSGHAAFYAALAAFACFYYGRAKYFWIGIALVGGILRIYQGVHYPSDVVAGWVIGFGITHFFMKSILTSPVLGYNKKKE